MKKFISFTLALAIILCSFCVSFAEPYTGLRVTKKNTTVPFPDAPTSAIATVLKDLGVLEGDQNGNANLDKPISRAECCTLIVKALKLNTVSYESLEKKFTDVSSGDWYADYIAAAVKASMVNGKGDGSYFAPEEYVSADEAVAYVIKALGYTEKNLEGSWPEKYRELALEINIVPAGFDFDAEKISRETVFSVLYKALDVHFVSWDSRQQKFVEKEASVNTINKTLGAAYDCSSVYTQTYKIVNQYDIEDIAKYSGFDASEYLGCRAFVLYKRGNPIAIGNVIAASNGAFINPTPAAIEGERVEQYALVLSAEYIGTDDFTVADTDFGEAVFQLKILPVGSETPLYFTAVSTSAIDDDCLNSAGTKFVYETGQIFFINMVDGRLTYIRPAISSFDYIDISNQYFSVDGVDSYVFTNDKIPVTVIKPSASGSDYSYASGYEAHDTFYLVNSAYETAYIIRGAGRRIDGVVVGGDSKMKSTSLDIYNENVTGSSVTSSAVTADSEEVWYYAFYLGKGLIEGSDIVKLGGYKEGEAYMKVLNLGSNSETVITGILSGSSIKENLYAKTAMAKYYKGDLIKYSIKDGELAELRKANSYYDYVNASGRVFVAEGACGYEYTNSTKFIKLQTENENIKADSLSYYTTGSRTELVNVSCETAMLILTGDAIDYVIYGGPMTKETDLSYITRAAILSCGIDKGGTFVQLLAGGTTVKKYLESGVSCPSDYKNLYDIELDYDYITRFTAVTKAVMLSHYEVKDLGGATTGAVVAGGNILRFTDSSSVTTDIPLVSPYILVWNDNSGVYSLGSISDIKDGVTKLLVDADNDYYFDTIIIDYAGD